MNNNNNNSAYIPPSLLAAAKSATMDILPTKSETKYKKCYEEFTKWQEAQGTNSHSETVFLAYFFELSQRLSSATLWSRFSMLKAMVNLEKNINLSNYTMLHSFLKKQHVGYEAKKAKVFTTEEVNKFLEEAPQTVLPTKVALILGLMGACRKCELQNMNINDIEVFDSHLTITLPETKTNKSRFFVINGTYAETVKMYLNSRPTKCTSTKFFLSYRNGKCTNQVIGKNKLGSMPAEIAKFLNLPDPLQYTGHSFRRTSATILADAGANISALKRHGGWKSASVAEGYVEESVKNKRKLTNRIVHAIDTASTSHIPSDDSDNECIENKRSKTVGHNSKVNNNFHFAFHFNDVNKK